LLTAVSLGNDHHKHWPRRQLMTLFPSLSGLNFFILGLSYKPGTNTLRRFYSVELCDWLIHEVGNVNVFDPHVCSLPNHWFGIVNLLPDLSSLPVLDVIIVAKHIPITPHILSQTKPIPNSCPYIIDTICDPNLNYLINDQHYITVIHSADA